MSLTVSLYQILILHFHSISEWLHIVLFFFGSSVGVLLLSFIILPLKSMVINELTTIFNVVFLMPVSVQCHLKTFYYI